MVRKRRRRRVAGPGAAMESLSVQDRYVLRFWYRYGVFVPQKGIELRTEAELEAKVLEFGGKAGLKEAFAGDAETAVVKARRREIQRWLKEGYLAGKASKVDPISREMVQHPVDRVALKKGCRFDTARALFAIEWMESHLTLYEGPHAGEPFVCRDWQDLVSRRLFGWVRWSPKWDRWIRRFRSCIVFIPKKNKKSPTLAAWGAYMAMGDGEPGQHFYFAAKDGQQAREIAGTHAMQMICLSALAGECRTDQNEMQITWYGQRVKNAEEAKRIQKRATIKPLSSSNARTTKSKEGLNGSFGVDESHVVDWEYIDIIKRMGISRPEPLRFDVSTAGNNPDGYGKDRRDYGLAVNECRNVEDIHTCAAIYEAPQNLSAEDLARDPVGIGKAANPAWGHTIDEAEFLADYQESTKSVVELRNFMMYRLNIWQKTASPWLDGAKWDACRQEYCPADLAGRVCGAAWDLMRSKDMAALGLAFPEEEAADLEARADMPYKTLLYYWMPEAAIEEYLRKVPKLRDWAEAGWIRVMPGEVINYQQIEEETAAILATVECQRFHYDPMFATASIQQLVETHGFDETRIAEFPQTTKYYSYPISVFDNLVAAGKLGHNGNPVTDWQAGHVCIWERDGKKRLTKPDGESNTWKKIDGIAALVMAFDAALRREDVANVYDGRGLLSV